MRVYNQFFEGKSGIVQSRLRNGRLILEGSIRIYWGVNSMIRLKEEHDDRIPVRRRRSSLRLSRLSMNLRDRENSNGKLFNGDAPTSPNIENGIEAHEEATVQSADNSPRRQAHMTNGEGGDDPKNGDAADVARSYNTLPNPGKRCLQDLLAEADLPPPFPEEANGFENVTLRSKNRSSRVKLRRRCSINGHFYNRETSVFTPAYASVTSVWVTSLVNAPEVINQLLDKFKVENSPQDFALYVVRDNGERRLMLDDEFPLLARVMLGPDESVAKLFIMNRENTNEIPHEVAQYLNFSEVELLSFIQKFYEEEEREVEKIKSRYATMRQRIQARMLELKCIPVTISSERNSDKSCK